MKLRLHFRPIGCPAAIAGFAVLFAPLFSAHAASADFVAHEWGTFTSVQAGSGELLAWLPLETSRLPGFVYNWNHPGFGRQLTGGAFLGKGVLVAYQRMETPVIYFYSGKRRAVDVSVDFPQGTITEWYPEVEKIGPAVVRVPPLAARLDSYAYKAGINAGFSFSSFLSDPSLKTSGAHWENVEILPTETESGISLPSDRSGSHYFAARETDANLLKVYSATATNRMPEYEKFLFYRGVGNFRTPLNVNMISRTSVIFQNNGIEPFDDLLVLSIENGAGTVVPLNHLGVGERRTLILSGEKHPLDQLSKEVAHTMSESLVSAGLYRREADAMVKTWADSWFAEDGIRVLYLLPRAWTDRTLPLKLNPQPRELVRVMVGRTEVLSPELQQKLVTALSKAQSGNTEAKAELISDFKKLGRFANPALALASRDAGPTAAQTGYALLQEAANSSP
jgi:hypothetical protein